MVQQPCARNVGRPPQHWAGNHATGIKKGGLVEKLSLIDGVASKGARGRSSLLPLLAALQTVGSLFGKRNDITLAVIYH